MDRKTEVYLRDDWLRMNQAQSLRMSLASPQTMNQYKGQN